MAAEVIDSSRRWDYGCTPHNWFSGKLVRLIRDLIVYGGDDRCLHLLGCLPPFLRSVSVECEGTPVSCLDGAWRLRVSARRVTVRWPAQEIPDIS